MIARLLRLPMATTLLVTLAAAIAGTAWFGRPLDRSALFAVHFSDGNMGYVTAEGRVAFSESWSSACAFDESGIAVVTIHDEKRGWFDGLLDRTGKFTEIRGPVFNTGPFDSRGLAPASAAGKWGFIDRMGEFVVPPVWDYVHSFRNEELALVRKGKLGGPGKSGFVDRTGRLAIPAEWDETRFWPRDDRIAVQRDGEWGYIDLAGKLVVPLEWDQAGSFDGGGLAAVSKNGKCGFIDPTGRVAIPLEWDEIKVGDPLGTICVRNDMRWRLIDRTGKRLLAGEWEELLPFDASGLAVVRIDGRYGYIDRTGRLAIPAEWESARSFAEKDPLAELACVFKPGKTSFIDRHGTIVIPIHWDGLGGFDESGLAVVMKEDADGLKQGYIDRVGKVVVPVEYRFGNVEKAAGTSIFRVEGYSDRLSEDRWERRIGLEGLLSAVGHPLPPRNMLCKLYDLDGNVVWSSDWLSERSQIVLAGLLIGLVAVAEIVWICARKEPAG
jgi:hypothetical protein